MPAKRRPSNWVFRLELHQYPSTNGSLENTRRERYHSRMLRYIPSTNITRTEKVNRRAETIFCTPPCSMQSILRKRTYIFLTEAYLGTRSPLTARSMTEWPVTWTCSSSEWARPDRSDSMKPEQPRQAGPAQFSFHTSQENVRERTSTATSNIPRQRQSPSALTR